MSEEKENKLTNKEIAEQINAFLVQFEKEQQKTSGRPEYYGAAAQNRGSRIFIQYISYQGSHGYSREEALHYLNWLKMGNRGSIFIALKDYVPVPKENQKIVTLYGAEIDRQGELKLREIKAEELANTYRLIPDGQSPSITDVNRFFNYNRTFSKKDPMISLTAEEAYQKLQTKLQRQVQDLTAALASAQSGLAKVNELLTEKE